MLWGAFSLFHFIDYVDDVCINVTRVLRRLDLYFTWWYMLMSKEHYGGTITATCFVCLLFPYIVCTAQTSTLPLNNFWKKWLYISQKYSRHLIWNTPNMNLRPNVSHFPLVRLCLIDLKILFQLLHRRLNLWNSNSL